MINLIIFISFFPRITERKQKKLQINNVPKGCIFFVPFNNDSEIICIFSLAFKIKLI